MTARVPATQTAQVFEATRRVLRGQTATAQAQPTITATEACGASSAGCNPGGQSPELDEGQSPEPVGGNFILQRPVPGGKIERSYPYGSTQEDTREAHHGVEFYYPFGTPVLAAADGVVVFAGDDSLPLPPGEAQTEGRPLGLVTSFYGNVVVLEHVLAGQKVFTVYGHLSQVNVLPGDLAQAGDKIGEIGASGKAIGSHLHFEVRLDYNDYNASYNPELWLEPLFGTGVLAGSISDANGNPLTGIVNLQRIENGKLNPVSVGQARTYAHEYLNSDPTWRETFAFGEIPAGEYRVSLVMYGRVYEQIVTIEAGKLTLVRFVTE